ncbi:MAG: hypothetical protein JNL43_05140 [Flavobacteriales bacterium]|nr:hypothetical protein [Flavobacteriales bacterium]
MITLGGDGNFDPMPAANDFLTSRPSKRSALGPGFGAMLMPGTVFLAAAFLLASCKHEPPVVPIEDLTGNGGGNGGGGGEEPVPCDPTIVYFTQQIQPLLISNCTMGDGCHSSATDENDGIDLTSYPSLMNSGIIQDGDLWEAINENDPDDIMPRPPQTPLTADQIALIGQWIQQGAQNNGCEDAACDTLNVTYSGTIRPVIQARCQGCHSGGTPQGGLDFTSWNVLNAVAQDGRLAGSIQHLPGYTAMPRNAPALPDCRVRQFLLWIGSGSPNN